MMNWIPATLSPDIIGKTMALGCAVFWAIAVILFKQSGEKLHPIALNFYKTFISLILFIPLFFIFDIPLLPEQATTRDYIMLSLSGIAGITIADSLFFKSLNILGAGLSAIVDCLYSPSLILLSWLLLSEHPSGVDLMGGGFIVLAVLIGSLDPAGLKRGMRVILPGVFYGSLSMVFIALGVIALKPTLDKTNALWVTEMRLFAATITLALQVYFRADRRLMTDSMKQSHLWKTAFPGTFLGSYLGMIVWIGAFQFTDVTSSAILNQTSTIFIVVLASIFLAEPFTKRRFWALILALSGSLMVILN